MKRLLLSFLTALALSTSCSSAAEPAASGTTRDPANKTSHSHHNGYEACAGHNFGRPGDVLIGGVWVPCKDTEFVNPPTIPLEETGIDDIVWPAGKLVAMLSTITYVEGGGYDFLPFSLSEAPIVPVIVRFEALDPTEIALSDRAVVEIEITADNYEMFGPNWRAPQDGIDDGDQTTQVRVSVIADPSDPIFRDTTDLMVTVITVDRAPSIDDH